MLQRGARYDNVVPRPSSCMLAQWAFSVRYEKIHYKWRLYNSRSPCSFIHVDCCSSEPGRQKKRKGGRKEVAGTNRPNYFKVMTLEQNFRNAYSSF